ncbi:MAG: hypothetical protein ACFFA6_01710 [Promethearchaeota archaeon]
MVKSQDHFWSFPLLAGILTLIGLFTPFAIEDGFYSWLWGGNYLEIGGDGYFYWIFELDFQDVTPLIFISNFALFITLLITAIGAIIYSLMLRKKGDFQRFERKWLILGILFIVATTIYLIEFEILMRYYFSEYLSIDASYWEFFDPGFALFAPFISGCITLIGFAINKYVLPKKRDWYFKIQQLCRNIIYILSIGFSFLFLGIVIIFMFFKLLPGDIVAAYFDGPFTQEQYLQMKHELGFDLPIILQFFRFIEELFTGSKSWISVSVDRPTEVSELLIGPTFHLINFMLAPIILGLMFGLFLGNISSRKKYTRIDKVFQLFCILGISIPIFFFGTLLQYFVCFKADLCVKPGNYWLAFSVFAIAVTMLISLQTRFFIVNKLIRKSIISYITITGITFGFIFLLYILLEATFMLNGLGRILLQSISQNDFYLIAGTLFIVLVLFVVTILISSIILSSYKFIVGDDSERNLTIKDEVNEDEVNKERESYIKIKKEEIKKYILNRLKSPFFIVGIILVVFILIIALFPQIFTPYTLAEAVDFYPNPEYPDQFPWMDPSKDNPLGTTKFGRDVLALIVWGIRDAVIFGSGIILISLAGILIFMFIIWISKIIESRIKYSGALTVLCILIYATIIGLIITPFLYPLYGLDAILFGLSCGVIFGIIMGILFFIRLHSKRSNTSLIFYTRVDKVILGFMIIFYIFPGVILLLLLMHVLGQQNWTIMYYLGILLIPIFMWIISNEISKGFNIKEVAKTIITYIPVIFALTILFYESLGFLGYYDYSKINLGAVFNEWQGHVDAFHAMFWPGLAIFGLLFSFLLLHLGLQKNKKNVRL